MGSEISQFREWDEKREQDWELKRYPAHDAFTRYMTELNHMYLSHPALWAEDYERDGFAWLDCHQEEKCVFIIRRRSEEETIIAAFNFSAQEQMVEIESGGAQWTLLFDTNWEKYGGTASEQERNAPIGNARMPLILAPFSGVLFTE